MKIMIPPIKIWIWVIVTFCLIQLTIIIFYNYLNKENIRDILFDNQLADVKRDFLVNNNNCYKVIVVGSSLVCNGIECTDAIKTTLLKKSIKNISVKKICQNGDCLEYFVKDKKLIKELLLIKPDLVCIQTELAAIRFEEPKRYIYSAFENFYVNLVEKNIIIGKNILSYGKPKYFACEDQYKKFEEIKDTVNYIATNRFVKPLKEINFFLTELKLLTDAGIKIIILDIPRPKIVENKIYSNPFLHDLDNILNMYKKQFGIEYWGYTGRPVYFKDTYDGAHLNETGRKLFTNNFLNKIIIEMGDKK